MVRAADRAHEDHGGRRVHLLWILQGGGPVGLLLQNHRLPLCHGPDRMDGNGLVYRRGPRRDRVCAGRGPRGGRLSPQQRHAGTDADADHDPADAVARRDRGRARLRLLRRRDSPEQLGDAGQECAALAGHHLSADVQLVGARNLRPGGAVGGAGPRICLRHGCGLLRILCPAAHRLSPLPRGHAPGVSGYWRHR